MENMYEIWIEGYAATGESQPAIRLGEDDELFSGDSFENACKNALIKLKWNMKSYDEINNTYWGCRFYNNEKDARKHFG